MLEINPRLTPKTLKAVVEYSAIPVLTATGQRADALTQGSGEINGGGAATLAWTIDSGAPIGQRWLKALLTPSTLIGDKTYLWTQSILWGNHIASGASFSGLWSAMINPSPSARISASILQNA